MNWFIILQLFATLSLSQGQSYIQPVVELNEVLSVERTAATSLNNDGTVFVAGFFRGNSELEVQGYHLIDDVWQARGSSFSYPTACDQHRCGKNVALSGDGKILAVGEMRKNSRRGKVYIYEWFDDVDDWELRQEIDGDLVEEYFGNSLSLSEDGQVLVVGAFHSREGFNQGGKTKIYNRQSTTEWSQIGQTLLGSGVKYHFGWSTAVSASGTVIAVGAWRDSQNGSQYGRVTVYSLDNGIWVQRTPIYGSIASERVGSSVALSSDGNIVAIGAVGGGPGQSGGLQIFEYDGVEWSQVGQDLHGNPAHGWGGSFGMHIDLSGNGRRVTCVDKKNYLVRNFEYDVGSKTWVDFFDDEIGDRVKYVYSAISGDGTTVIYGHTTRNGNSGAISAMNLSQDENHSPTATPTPAPSAAPTHVEEIDLGLSFSVSACECDASYHCTNNIYVKSDTAPLLQVCIFPNSASAEITNFDLKLVSTNTNFEYNPVQIGPDGPINDDLTTINENGHIKKVTTRIVHRLFDGGDKIHVSGSVRFGSGKQEELENVEFTINTIANEVNKGCFLDTFRRVSRLFYR